MSVPDAAVSQKSEEAIYREMGEIRWETGIESRSQCNYNNLERSRLSRLAIEPRQVTNKASALLESVLPSPTEPRLTQCEVSQDLERCTADSVLRSQTGDPRLGLTKQSSASNCAVNQESDESRNLILPSEGETNAMKLHVTLVVLLMLSLPGISEETKPARLGVTRGYGLGSFWAEIQIDRTVYVSHDYCEAAGLIGSYPAEVRKNMVRLLVGNKVCKYHILYDRPALKRGVRNKEASNP